MEINERYAYMWLNHITTFRLNDVPRLLNKYEDVISVVERLNNNNELCKLKEEGVLKTETCDEINGLHNAEWLNVLSENMDKYNIKVVTPSDINYPERLRTIPEQPLAIYYRGDISLADSDLTLGVVGSRRPTHYGMSVAAEFSGVLASKGITIVSGLAMGIDGRAHRSAMENNGKTIGVMGGGVDICYPRSNIDIFSEMCDEQLVLSEYEPGRAHLSANFPRRNRIISGMSDGLLVVEAAMRSGTLITADCALEQGKTIYAIPGRTMDMMSKGVNNLIKQGAMLVDSPADIVLDMMGAEMLVASSKSSKTKITQNIKSNKDIEKERTLSKLNASQKKLLGLLGYEPIFIDDLIRANGMKIAATIHDMKLLEEYGLVESIEQSYYILKR